MKFGVRRDMNSKQLSDEFSIDGDSPLRAPSQTVSSSSLPAHGPTGIGSNTRPDRRSITSVLKKFAKEFMSPRCAVNSFWTFFQSEATIYANTQEAQPSPR